MFASSDQGLLVKGTSEEIAVFLTGKKDVLDSEISVWIFRSLKDMELVREVLSKSVQDSPYISHANGFGEEEFCSVKSS